MTLHWSKDDENDHSLCGGCESPDCTWRSETRFSVLLLVFTAVLWASWVLTQ